MIPCKAAITDGKGSFFIDEIQVGPPTDDEVLVQMKAAGLCHTDYDSLSWEQELVLGHEGAGVVVETGANVEHVKPDDAVILNWATHCGHCFQCNLGNLHICENSSPVTASSSPFSEGHAHAKGTTFKDKPIPRSFNIGTLSEYTLVKSTAVVKNTAAHMSFPAAAIISCGVMTGYGSVLNAAKVKKGTSVVVLGAGGVGLNVIQAAKICQAKKIIAIDINPQRLKMAKTFGATHSILVDKNDAGLLSASIQVKQLTDGRGADYAFECTAIPQLGAAPLAMVRNAGMAVQVSGIEQEISFDMNLFEWDKIYINPLYGQAKPQEDFPKIIKQYESGELLLEEMITQTYSLDDLKWGFDDLLAGKNAKGVVVF